MRAASIRIMAAPCLKLPVRKEDEMTWLFLKPVERQLRNPALKVLNFFAFYSFSSTGFKITDKEIKSLVLEREEFHGE